MWSRIDCVMIWWFAGSEGIDKLLSSEKVSRDGGVGSRWLSPLPNLINEESYRTSKQTLTLLEEAPADSHTYLMT